MHHYGNEAEERIVINGIPLREKQVVQFDSEMCSYTDQFQITVFKDPERIPVGAGPMYNNPQCGKEYDLQKAYIDAGVYSSISEASKKSFRYTFTPNDYIGYTYTDFVFPGELTTNYNNSVCDVLDKIKNAFSNFEYFYKNDTFYFQEKNNFLNQRDIFNVLDSSDTASNIITDGYINGEQISIDIGEFLSPYNGGQDVSTLASYWLNVNPKSQYVFNDNNIVVAFSNTPKYENIKNDFVVWGNRKNGSNKNAVRYHLAIDKKPEFGNQYLIAKGRASEDGSLISDYDNSYANGVSFIITTGSVEDTTALPFPGCVGVTYALVHGSESSDRENVIKNALLGINKGYDLNSGPLCSSEGADVNQLNDSSIALYYWDPSAIDENKCWVKYPNGTGRLKIVTTKDWRDEIYLNGLYSDVKGTTPSYY